MNRMTTRMLLGTALLGSMTALSTMSASADSPGEPVPGVANMAGDELAARALVLTITQKSAGTPSPRAVVLQCSPLGGGTHPRTREACAALESANGDVRRLKPSAGTICPMVYEPVTVSAVGVWKSRFTMSSQTYGNSCQMNDALGAVGLF